MTELKKITQDELNDILYLHEKYVEGEKGGVRAVLENYDLSTLNLYARILNGIIIKSCKCTSTNFTHSELTDAILESSDFSRSCFKFVFFVNTDFTGCDFINSDFRDAKIINACLRNANFAGSRFKGAFIEGTNFTNVDF